MGNRTSGSNTIAKCSEDLWPYVWAIRDPECLDWKRGLTDEEIEVLSLRQSEMPVEITETLFLSTQRHVEDVNHLNTLGITHVLNVAGKGARGPVDLYKAQGITYKEIDAHDEPGYDMIGGHLKECQAFIEVAKAAGGKCVVHCHAGINRSGVIVAAVHLLQGSEANRTNTNVLDTVAHCRHQRSNCFLWNHCFQLQLVCLAKENNLLGPMPGSTGCIALDQAPPYTTYLAEFANEGSESGKKGSIKDLF